MSDPLTNSLLDSREEHKGGTTYSLYQEHAAEPSLFKRLFSTRRHIILLAAVSLIITLAILIPFVASAAGKGEPLPPSYPDSSSTGGTGALPPSFGSSSAAGDGSTGLPGPIFTQNLTIAGMFVTQHGTGDRVVIAMPNVFGIGASLWNLSMSYAMAGFRSYAVDTVFGGLSPSSPHQHPMLSYEHRLSVPTR